MSLWSHPVGKSRSTATMVALALFASAGCASGVDGPGGTPPVVVSRQMVATVDGAAWTSASVAVQLDATQLIIIASAGTSVSSEQLTVAFHRTGPGDQILDGITGGWYGELRDPAPFGLWQTGHGGAKGIVTLTTLTANRAVGTFSFDAGTLSPASLPPVRHVTGGSFDVTF